MRRVGTNPKWTHRADDERRWLRVGVDSLLGRVALAVARVRCTNSHELSRQRIDNDVTIPSTEVRFRKAPEEVPLRSRRYTLRILCDVRAGDELAALRNDDRELDTS